MQKFVGLNASLFTLYFYTITINITGNNYMLDEMPLYRVPFLSTLVQRQFPFYI